jgi:hypothetical protein
MNNNNWSTIKRNSLRQHFSEERGIGDFKITDELMDYIFSSGYAIRRVENYWIVPSSQYNDVMELLKWKPVYDVEWENRKKRKTRKLLMFGI